MEGFFTLEYTAGAPSVHISAVGWWTRLERSERTRFELSGPRGKVSLEAGALRFVPASVDEETVELAERARRVAVRLEPEARRRLEERLAREGICSVEGYLALLSAQLGARVELAESDRWSPEADAALKELLETLRRLAGA